MLIIFDLDDTLIDTSGSVLPVLARRALSRMEKAGLNLPDFEAAYQEMMRIDRGSMSSRASLKEFLELFDAPKELYLLGEEEIYLPNTFDFPVCAMDHVPDLLVDMRHEHTLCLVSVGVPRIQQEKMQKSGIDMTLFSEVAFAEPGKKKEHYIRMIEESGVLPSKVVVCGDRIKTDLTPAKELGCHTVHMKWGRGLGYTGFKKDVDYTILGLKEILDVIEQLEEA